MLTAHMAKTDNNLKSFLKNKLQGVLTKKKTASNSEIMNNIIKTQNFDCVPDIFKSKSITANLKVDNEKLKSDLNKCFDLLGKEFKMGSVSDE